jgi:hypothetical protein
MIARVLGRSTRASLHASAGGHAADNRAEQLRRCGSALPTPLGVRHDVARPGRYRDNKASEEGMKQLPDRVKKSASSNGKTLHYLAVDARRPASASKVSP